MAKFFQKVTIVACVLVLGATQPTLPAAPTIAAKLILALKKAKLLLTAKKVIAAKAAITGTKLAAATKVKASVIGGGACLLSGSIDSQQELASSVQRNSALQSTTPETLQLPHAKTPPNYPSTLLLPPAAAAAAVGTVTLPAATPPNGPTQHILPQGIGNSGRTILPAANPNSPQEVLQTNPAVIGVLTNVVTKIVIPAVARPAAAATGFGFLKWWKERRAKAREAAAQAAQTDSQQAPSIHDYYHKDENPNGYMPSQETFEQYKARQLNPRVIGFAPTPPQGCGTTQPKVTPTQGCGTTKVATEKPSGCGTTTPHKEAVTGCGTKIEKAPTTTSCGDKRPQLPIVSAAEAQKDVKNSKFVKPPQNPATEKFNITTALNDIPGSCAKLDPSLGDIKKIERAIQALKDIPGAHGKDSPIVKVLEFGGNQKTLSTARGAFYEVEKAYDLLLKGEKIKAFGAKPTFPGTATREFDIATENALIECKNLTWSKTDIEAFQGKIIPQKQMADKLNKKFELYSKNPIPDILKQWLKAKNITFFEG
jgi:hypothetical protein